MRGAKRATALAAVALGGSAAVQAQGHHDGKLPRALERNLKVKKIYPDLYRREQARDHTRWPRLATMARTRWMHQHRCDPRTLTRRYELGTWVWRLIEKRWECTDVPGGTRSFLRCIAGAEGGHSWSDVWYGGSRGWQGGRFAGSDRVVNPFQFRPFWAVLAHPYATERYVTWRTFAILTNPVHAADLAHRVSPSAYATVGVCS